MNMKHLLIILFMSLAIGVLGQNLCLEYNSVKIVVLGSSTAAGTGPSHPDSTWVNRYKNYLLSVNPNNEVINLAIGGYNTYRIMPTSFTPPANRPSPDPLRNITAALGYQPDAIIVNMPSNDVAAGFSVQEQLFNFDSIVSTANLGSTPIWICTTQPRNFSDSLLRQKQFDLKDSIWLNYSPNVLDFWTPFATSSYYIDSIYDSGDGVHMNDTAHAILASTVIAANIEDSVLGVSSEPDLIVHSISSDASICGDSSTNIQIVVANVGANTNTSSVLSVSCTNLSNQTSNNDQFSLLNLPSCLSDTINWTVNTFEQGNYFVQAIIANAEDTVAGNDTLSYYFSTSGHPELIGLGDTLCEAGSAELSAIINVGDTVFWYDSPGSLTPVGYGTTFYTPVIDTTTIFYAEAIRGHLYYVDELTTTLNSNINYNGAMFDVVANDQIVVDSIGVKINSIGQQSVTVYAINESHLGNENTPGLWSSLGVFNVEVVSNNELTYIPVTFAMNSSDTIGIYTHMTNSGSNLSYKSLSAPVQRSNSEIEIITGSGIAYNFGNSFYPRDLNCAVHYHFGERLDGDCKTERQPIEAIVAEPFSVIPDTIIDVLDTLIIDVPLNVVNPMWYDGSTEDSLILSGSDLGLGIHHLSLTATDLYNCEHTVDFIVGVADLVGMQTIEYVEVRAYPNPTEDKIYVVGVPVNTAYQIIDLQGSILERGIYNGEYIDFGPLSCGTYLLHFQGYAKPIRAQKITDL